MPRSSRRARPHPDGWHVQRNADRRPGQHNGYTPVRPPGEWNTFLFLASGDYLEGWVNGERAIAGQDGRWGTGNISLVAQRVDRAPFQARFRNLQIWDGVLPDPTTVW